MRKRTKEEWNELLNKYMMDVLAVLFVLGTFITIVYSFYNEIRRSSACQQFLTVCDGTNTTDEILCRISGAYVLTQVWVFVAAVLVVLVVGGYWMSLRWQQGIINYKLDEIQTKMKEWEEE